MKNKTQTQRPTWQRDPESVNDYLIQLWNQDRVQIMTLGRRQAQELVRSGWAYVIAPYAIVRETER
jgi:hypothetical protein